MAKWNNGLTVFGNSIEGGIADGIERWLTKNDYPMPIDDEGLFVDDTVSQQDIYAQMGAYSWLTSTDTEDETFAYICSHDPYQMFQLAFQIVLLRRNIKVMGQNAYMEGSRDDRL